MRVLRWYSQAAFVISDYSRFQTPAGARQSRSEAKFAGDAKVMSACDKAPWLLLSMTSNAAAQVTLSMDAVLFCTS